MQRELTGLLGIMPLNAYILVILPRMIRHGTEGADQRHKQTGLND